MTDIVVEVGVVAAGMAEDVEEEDAGMMIVIAIGEVEVVIGIEMWSDRGIWVGSRGTRDPDRGVLIMGGVVGMVTGMRGSRIAVERELGLLLLDEDHLRPPRGAAHHLRLDNVGDPPRPDETVSESVTGLDRRNAA